MTPDEVAEIFVTAMTAYEAVTSKPTYTDADRFDEKVNSILVELQRDHDGDEFGLLHSGQDTNKHNALTGSSLSKIGKHKAYDSSVDSSGTEADRKKAEAMWMVRLNDNKVGLAEERGAKKMLSVVFDDTCANKLKHPIKIYAGVSYFKLIDHLRVTYRKLHQLNMSELLTEMTNSFDVNEGFSKHIEKTKEAQKVAATVDPNLINDATLLRMGVESMHHCGLFGQALDDWEELAQAQQTWLESQTYFLDAEEQFYLKKRGHMVRRVEWVKLMLR